MTRDEFLGRLGELLACLPAEQVEETKAFYAEAIADRMEDGMSEEEAVAAMGTPGEVAEATLDDLPAVPRAIARTRRRSTALLWVLTIVGSPVWVPLLAAFVHLAFAQPMIWRILRLFGLQNLPLVLGVTACACAVFTVLYCAACRLTERRSISRGS